LLLILLSHPCRQHRHDDHHDEAPAATEPVPSPDAVADIIISAGALQEQASQEQGGQATLLGGWLSTSMK
jgi:hypothetical protein